MSKKSNQEQDERLERLRATLKQLQKKSPDCPIGFGSELEKELTLTYITTGIPALDNFIGGGWPRRRFSVIGGPKGVGKSTLMMSTIAAAQKTGCICVYADLENTYDPAWAKTQGVDTNNLIHISGNTAEEALDAMMTLYESKTVDLVIIDSIAALAPKGELMTKDGEQRTVEDDSMALIPRKLSQFFRMACEKNARSNCATILIAQCRAAIGSYGAPERITGGNALAHYNSLTLMLRRGSRADAPKDGDQEIGFDMIVKIAKTKLNDRELQQMSMPFLFGAGISRRVMIIRLAIEKGLITQSGARYEDTVNGKKYHGAAALRAMEDTDVDQLESKLTEE